VKLEDTIKGFKAILEGELDSVSEQDFYMKGDISEIKK
jgi:F-type H+-transporting ATPase subunit beta